MKILICDDEQENVDILQNYVTEYMRTRNILASITAVTNPATIICKDCSFDLALLDIQMPGVDGITLAKKLRQHNAKMALFFITNYDEYQDDAMDLQAFRFFEKPFQAKRLYSGLDKAMEYIDGAYVDLYLPDNGAQQRVLADDILYVTRSGRKTSVETIQRLFSVTTKYDDLCEALPQLFFYAVHKSFFVNLHYVERYAYNELTLTNGMRIPIAPKKQAAFHKFWFDYLRKR